MDTLKKILIFIIAVLFSGIVSPYFGYLYDFIFSPPDSIFIALNGIALVIIGFIFACVFFITFLYTALTKKHRYWWIGIPLLPVLYIEIVSDLLHIYFPIIIGLIGWGLGLLVFKLRNKQ